MAIMRYKLALPDSKVGKHRGIMISNFENAKQRRGSHRLSQTPAHQGNFAERES